jgi:hypothetical protein
MTPITQLYWSRVALGLVAGIVTALIVLFSGGATALYDLSWLLNSITVALLIFFITYYIFRAVYKTKIEKPSKILSTGIGMYFFTWIACFVLSYTALIVLLGIDIIA